MSLRANLHGSASPTADSTTAYGSTPAENLQSATATTRTADSPPAYGSTPVGRDRPLRTAESTPDKQTFAHPPLSKRIRTLTVKNKELYEQKVKKFELIIKTKWNLVGNQLNLIDTDNRKAVLKNLRSSASHCFHAYDEFLAFLCKLAVKTVYCIMLISLMICACVDVK